MTLYPSGLLRDHPKMRSEEEVGHEIIMGRAMPEPNSGCWLWLGELTTDGYGRFEIDKRRFAAHRVAYQMLIGPIPAGLTLDHKCRVRCCVNPAHLEPVTNKVNVLRGISPAALHARQTHCKNGHPFSGDNLFIERGFRRCRICQRAAGRKSYHKLSPAAEPPSGVSSASPLPSHIARGVL